MPASDGPFGTAPDIGIGFSDAALLTFSFAGFGFLAYSLYSIVLMRLKTRTELGNDDDNDEDGGQKYEEQLTRADVSTLSRAQRRARARQIMKQQRRAVPQHQVVVAAAADGGAQEGEGQQQQQLAVVRGQVQPDNDDDHHQEDQPVLSRKERQRLAKAAEREERKLLEEERKQQQELAQKQAQQRKTERLQAQAKQQEEARRRQLEEQQAAEKAKQEAWEIFLSSSNETGVSLSVSEWLERCQHNRFVSMDDLKEEFGISVDIVKRRIEQLVREHLVVGVFAEEKMFLVFYKTELRALVDKLKKEGCVTASDISGWMNDQVKLRPSAKH